MDKTRASGARDTGSIPVEGNKKCFRRDAPNW